MEREGFWLGVDLGTCVTSAAARDSNSVAMLSLGRDGHDMPSVVAITEDGVLVGEAAHRRGRTEPASVAREFKRRMGDDTPLIVGGQSVSPEWLTAQVLDHVLKSAREQRGAAPDGVTLSYPATWGEHRRRQLSEVAALAGLDSVELVTEPEAAARFAAENGRLNVGELAAIFDLGGGTFDTALVRRVETTSYDVIGKAIGLERLGGVDLDEALFDHVLAVLDLDLAALPDTPAVLAAMVQLRDDVVAAKETLSFDTSTVVPVMIEGRQTQVRVNRSEFETLARPFVDKAIDTVEEAIAGAGIDPSDIDLIIPVGGTSRVPLVAERLASRLGIAMTETANPRHAVALGAASASPAPKPAPAPTTLAGPPAAADPLSSQTVPTAPAMPDQSRRPSGSTKALDQPEPVLPSTSTPTSASTRFQVIGAITALVVGGIAGLWLLGDRAGTTSTQAGGASPDESADLVPGSSAASEFLDSISGLPIDGFDFADGVRSAQTFGSFAAPLSDSGPDALPQRMWQTQFSGLHKRPVGHAGVLVLEEFHRIDGSSVLAVDPRSGATRWTYEAPGFLQHYFVGDDGVAVLLTGRGSDGEQDLIVVLLDLETGEPRTRLDVTPPSVDLGFDHLAAAELVESVLITTWSDDVELTTTAFDVSAVDQLWQERDPASGPGGGASDGATYVTFGDGSLVARDLRTGERLWSTTDVDFYSVRAISGGVVVLSSATGRTDYAGHDLRSGEVRWTIAKGLTFGFAADDSSLYAVESGSEAIYSVDLRDGSLRWETRIASPRNVPVDVMVAGDQIYLLDSDNNFAIFDRRNGDAIWSTTMDNLGDFLQITAAGDVLFVQDGESVTAFG